MTYGLTARDLAHLLKRQLDVREEENETTRGYVFGRKYIAEFERTGTKNRARKNAPSFDVPSPCTERPMSADGRTPFHCNIRPISKTKPAPAKGSNGAEGNGHAQKQRDPAASHEKYICRDAKGDPVVSFDQYLTQIGKPNAAVDHNRVFTNIHADPVKRQEYWSAVVQCEREPQDDRYRLQFGRLKPMQENGFSTYMSKEMALACRQYWYEKLLGNDPRQHSVLISRADYDHLKQHCEADGIWDKKSPPVTISKGRGGRIQYRSEIEFPDGLDAAARFRIAYQICAKLKSIGVMFTAAIHQPDEHNNEKNWHFHIVFHDRPAEYLVDKFGNPRVDADGKELGWDFAYAVGGSRKSYPERKNKIRAISAITDSRRNDPEKNFASLLRHEWSSLCNVELEKAKVTYRFDPGSYEKLGIPYEPGTHLGNKASALECLGVPTIEGMRNAEKRWAGKWRSDDANAAARAKARKELVGLAKQAIADLATASSALPERDELARLLSGYTGHCASIKANERSLLEFERYLGMAMSRAAMTENHCRQRIEALEARGANVASHTELADLVYRHDSATAYRNSILDLVGGEGSLAALRDEYHADQQALADLGRQILDIVGRTPQMIEQARVLPQLPKPALTMSSPSPSPITMDAVFTRIARDKLVIEERGEQEKRYRVHGLTRAEVDVLRKTDDVAARSQSRLAGMYAGRVLTASTRGPSITAAPRPVHLDTDARGRERTFDYGETDTTPESDASAAKQADADRAVAHQQYLAGVQAFHDRLHAIGVLAIDIERGRKWRLPAIAEQDRPFVEQHGGRPEMLALLDDQNQRAIQGIAREIIQKGSAVYDPKARALIAGEFSLAVRPFLAHFACEVPLIRYATAKHCTAWNGDVLDLDEQWPLRSRSAPYRFQSTPDYPLAQGISYPKTVIANVQEAEKSTAETVAIQGPITPVVSQPIPLDIQQAFQNARSGRGR